MKEARSNIAKGCHSKPRIFSPRQFTTIGVILERMPTSRRGLLSVCSNVDDSRNGLKLEAESGSEKTVLYWVVSPHFDSGCSACARIRLMSPLRLVGT